MTSTAYEYINVGQRIGSGWERHAKTGGAQWEAAPEGDLTDLAHYYYRRCLVVGNGGMAEAEACAASLPDPEPKAAEPDPERINHPSHYRPGRYEAIKVIEAWELGFHLGNAIKYISRAGRKSESKAEDLRKAIWYLEREIKREEGGGGDE